MAAARFNRPDPIGIQDRSRKTDGTKLPHHLQSTTQSRIMPAAAMRRSGPAQTRASLVYRRERVLDPMSAFSDHLVMEVGCRSRGTAGPPRAIKEPATHNRPARPATTTRRKKDGLVHRVLSRTSRVGGGSMG